jgi:hypothetical protein
MRPATRSTFSSIWETGVIVHGGEEARERGGFAILPWFLT